jgi:hypothetical protein
MPERPFCPPSPCSTCPYRKDTPPGIWAAEEYRKLPEYDADGGALAPFHCHQENITGVPTLCRGWVSCHGFESIAVRLACVHGLISAEQVEAPCRVELYATGREACAAGLAGVLRPGVKARRAIDKLVSRGRST